MNGNGSYISSEVLVSKTEEEIARTLQRKRLIYKVRIQKLEELVEDLAPDLASA
jgi:hypothetical protein